MTVLAAPLKSGGLLFPLPPSEGVSPAADELRDIIHQTLVALATSVAVGGTAEATSLQLRRLKSVASQPNWDGHGSLPLNERSAARAMKLIQALPTTIPIPDVSVDPDGEVDLLWQVTPTRTISISVGPTGKLAYAALIGDTQSYGTEWLAHEIPHQILYNLSRVLDRNR